MGGLLPEFKVGTAKGLATINSGSYACNIFMSGNKQIKLLSELIDDNLVTFVLLLSGDNTGAIVLITCVNNILTSQSIKTGNSEWTLTIKNNTLYVSSSYASSILNAKIIPMVLAERHICMKESNDDLSSPTYEEVI